MVAGNHNRLDACTTANGYSILGLGTRRIDHAHQTHKGQAIFQHLRGGIFRHGVDHLIGHRQHTQCIGAHFLRHALGRFNIAGNAARGHHIEGTLHDHHELTVDIVDGGHQLAVRVKGDLCQAGILGVQIILLKAILMRSHHNGGFGGIADVLLTVIGIDHGAVTAQGAVVEQLTNSLRIGAADQFNLATVHVCLGQGHAVLGQSTGLIRANNGSTAQGLHRRQTANQRISLDHALHANGQNDGNDGRQTLWNGRNCQRYCGHEQVHPVQLIQQTHHKNYSAGSQGHKAQVLAQLCQLLLQRGCALFLAVQQVCNLAHLGFHTGGGNNGQSRTVGNAATGENHIGTVTNGGIFIHHNGGILFRRHGFASQRSFLRLEAGATKQTGICRNKVTGFQLNDVAGHQSGGIDHLFHTVTDHTGMGCGHIFQGIQGFFSLALLIHTHYGVQDHDQNDQAGFKQFSPILLDHDHRQRDHGCDHQNDDHGILELVKETLERGLLLFLTQLVFAVLAQLLSSLLFRQATGHIRLQLLNHVQIFFTVCFQFYSS